MADNITLDEMTGGSIVATDDVGGAHHQYVKVEYGADGAATPVSASNPLPVTNISGTIQNSGTTTGVGVVTSITNLAGGTVQLNRKPTVTPITIGSVWGTSSGTAGTIVAAPGASNSIYINELSITNEGTSNLKAGVSFGTAQTGTAVVKMATMAGNGGIEVPFPMPVGRHFANTPLVIWTTGSGTASFSLSYWTEAQ